jgi:phenylpropionate dioxygenase-like ring-hydroxylating dioxygenase large terminal subunit
MAPCCGRRVLSVFASLIVVQLHSFAATAFFPTIIGRRMTHPRNRIGTRSNNVQQHIADSKVTFDYKTEWYPVAPVQDLTTDAPNKLTLLGMDLAIWYHEPSGQWRAFADVCPHRLVPLSEGRIESSGVLQCAYHGWEFAEDGACVSIPQLNSPSVVHNRPRACATSFPVRTEQDLVWIFPTPDESKAASKDPCLIPELDDPKNVDATNFFVRDMPYSWEILVENLCDPAHVPFAHHSFMNGADRKHESLQLDLEVIEETPHGFRARKDPYPQGNGKYDVEFQAPCLLYYKIVNSAALGKDTDDPSKTNNFIGLGSYCIPTAPGWCRLIARFPFRLSFTPAMYIIRHTPRWITHLSQNIIMDSDVVFLCSQDERLSREKANYYMPARCDAMVSAFRKWLITAGTPTWLGTPAARSSGERLGWIRPTQVPLRGGRDALLDRYRQHTDICTSCRGAHKSLYKVQEILSCTGVFLLAVAAGQTKSRITAAAAVVLLLAPRVLLRPLIARLECVPWPRKRWVK